MSNNSKKKTITNASKISNTCYKEPTLKSNTFVVIFSKSTIFVDLQK